jgi:hypothetical protein
MGKGNFFAGVKIRRRELGQQNSFNTEFKNHVSYTASPSQAFVARAEESVHLL